MRRDDETLEAPSCTGDAAEARLLRRASVWLGVGMTVCLAGCVSAGSAGATNAESSRTPTIAGDCATGGQGLRTLRLAPSDAAAARASLRWQEPASESGERLELSDVSLLQGECAHGLQAFLMSDLYLSGGVALRLDGNGQPQPSDEAAAGSSHLLAIKAGQPHPRVPGKFLMAAQVNASGPDTQAGDFVGLWALAGRWRVGAFSRDASGGFSAVRTLLESSLPLRSVSYFPASHAQAGRLALVQVAGEEMRLISLYWSHPRAASR